MNITFNTLIKLFQNVINNKNYSYIKLNIDKGLFYSINTMKVKPLHMYDKTTNR